MCTRDWYITTPKSLREMIYNRQYRYIAFNNLSTLNAIVTTGDVNMEMYSLHKYCN